MLFPAAPNRTKALSARVCCAIPRQTSVVLNAKVFA
jgi:hypothetical protein